MAIRKWDFARQLTAAMCVVIASALLSSIIGVAQLSSVSTSKDRVTAFYADNAISVTKLGTSVERRSASTREYLLTGDPRALRRTHEQKELFDSSLPELRARTMTADGRVLVDLVDRAERAYSNALSRTLALRNEGREPAVILRAFEDEVVPREVALREILARLQARKEQQLTDAVQASATGATHAVELVVGVASLAFLVAVVLAVLLRRATTELVRTKQRIENANEDLDSFAGRVAHDVRGTLSPVLLASALLRNRELTRDQVDAVSRRLERSVARAVRLTDALLAFSRSGAAPDTDATASVRDVVTDVVEEQNALTTRAEVALTIDVHDAQIACPAGLLQVIVGNLLGNAVKFLRDRAVRKLSVRGAVTSNGYELRFEDTGPGIPEEAQSLIFEPFYRVPGTRAGGTGIGLASVRRIVDAYGGRITVESKLGDGAAFHVWLPLARQGAAALERSGAPRASPITS